MCNLPGFLDQPRLSLLMQLRPLTQPLRPPGLWTQPYQQPRKNLRDALSATEKPART